MWPSIPEGDLSQFSQDLIGDTRYVDRMLQLLVFGHSFLENRELENGDGAQPRG